MDKNGTLELNLNNLCRVCLTENENIKNILTDHAKEASLMEMFNKLSDYKVDYSTNSVFTQLCVHCVERLEVSYHFQQQCNNNYKVLQQYINNTHMKEVAVNKSEVKEEQTIEFYKTEPINNEYSNDSNSDSQEYRYEEKKKAPTRKKQNYAKQTMRLTQYSYNEVTEAINNANKHFIENVECIKCGFVGTNARALSAHMSHLHKEVKERWCLRCNAEFDNLEQHIAQHGQEGLKCQFCDKIFNSKGHLTEHLRSHSGIRPYKCSNCDKCFISSRHLKVHYRTHTNERPYKCNFCSKSFIQRYSLKNHMECHTKVSECANCGVEQKSTESHVCKQSDIEARKKSFTPMTQNFCEICDKRVRSLNVHIKQFHSQIMDRNPKVYDDFGYSVDNTYDNKLCTVCGKQFKTSSKLKVHMRIHTGEAPYKCTFCDKRISTRHQLVVHERTHTGERPHVCNVCGKRFSQSSVLNTHMKLHTGRTEVCNICDQRFCRPAELKLHMRKHTGEKPFLCTECGQAFIQRSHLMEHTKTHSDIRPYSCTYCDKTFKQNSALKSHVQIHLGYKPYRCNQCPYACRQSYSLTQHMKQHSSDTPRADKPHVCLVCHKHFTTIAMLLSHTSMAHSGTL